MSDIFLSARRMLDRAEHHLRDLDTQVKAFAREKPWSHVIEMDDEGTTELHKIRFGETVSDDLPHIIFDCANNTRSALDQMSFAIAVRYTGKSTPKSAKFPFGPDATAFVNNLKGGCKDLPPEIQMLYASFKPYKGGNNTLWGLNELANGPKHRTLMPVMLGNVAMTFTRLPSGNANLVEPLRWDRAKNEIIFAEVREGGEFKYSANLTFGVAFDDVDDVIRGQSPIGFLASAIDEVARVLAAAETASRDLGLIP